MRDGLGYDRYFNTISLSQYYGSTLGCCYSAVAMETISFYRQGEDGEC